MSSDPPKERRPPALPDDEATRIFLERWVPRNEWPELIPPKGADDALSAAGDSRQSVPVDRDRRDRKDPLARFRIEERDPLERAIWVFANLDYTTADLQTSHRIAATIRDALEPDDRDLIEEACIRAMAAPQPSDRALANKASEERRSLLVLIGIGFAVLVVMLICVLIIVGL